MIKNLFLVTAMFSCSVAWAFDKHQAERLDYFESLDAYNLCYEIEITDRTDDLEGFYTGMYEMARRALDPMDLDCRDGRSDASLDFLNESISND